MLNFVTKWKRTSQSRTSVSKQFRRFASVECRSTPSIESIIANHKYTVGRKFWETNPHLRRVYLDWLGQQLGLRTYDDWYGITQSVIQSFPGGRSLLESTNHSPYQLLCAAFPEHVWQPWKFKSTPNNWWSDIVNQRLFLDWLRNELNMHEYSDLYKLTYDIVYNNGGSRLLEIYGKSVAKMLAAVYPEYTFYPWLFSHCPRQYWENPANVHLFMNWFKTQHNINTMEDFYGVTMSMVRESGGSTLLSKYNNSIVLLLQSMYPQHKWKVWKFRVHQDGFWKDINNQKLFFDDFMHERGHTSLSSLYDVTYDQIVQHGGTFLNQYDSLCNALSTLYPNHQWLPWLFKSTSHDWWKSADNQRYYISWLSRKLGLKDSLDALYDVTNKVIVQHKGWGLLTQNNGSFAVAVMKLYPNHKWMPWKFAQAPRGWWRSRENRIMFIEWLCKEKLNFTSLDEYHQLTKTNLLDNGGMGRSIYTFYNQSIPSIFVDLFPQHEWKFQQTYRNTKTQSQVALRNIIENSFSSSKIIERAKLSDVTNPR